MIPKIIHYCWFGRGELPPLAQRCIDSWRKYLPDFEIRRWDEDNFPVQAHPYTADAYKSGLYAFVSDYARFKILYEQGGLYFDTDVELIRPIDDLIAKGPFMGVEVDAPDSLAVNPGLGLCAEAGMPIYKEILERYDTLPFYLPDGTRNPYTMIPLVTELLSERGLKAGEGICRVAGLDIYPQEWFNPFDDATGRLNKSGNTRSIHWYSKSWMPSEAKWKTTLKRAARRLLGKNIVSSIGNVFKYNSAE